MCLHKLMCKLHAQFFLMVSLFLFCSLSLSQTHHNRCFALLPIQHQLTQTWLPDWQVSSPSVQSARLQTQMTYSKRGGCRGKRERQADRQTVVSLQLCLVLQIYISTNLSLRRCVSLHVPGSMQLWHVCSNSAMQLCHPHLNLDVSVYFDVQKDLTDGIHSYLLKTRGSPSSGCYQMNDAYVPVVKSEYVIYSLLVRRQETI